MIRILLCVVLTALPFAPALAEETVLVTPFRVSPPELGTVGIDAANLVATSLGRGQVAVRHSLVEQELALRQWLPPLSREQLLSVAATLKSSRIVVGAITVSTVGRRKEQARIELALTLVDSGSNTLLAAVVPDPVTIPLPAGTPPGNASRPVAEPPSPSVIMQALGRIVTDAAARLVPGNRTTGKVLVAEPGGDVHLNLGRRDGLRKGDRFLVTRREIDPVTRQWVTRPIGEVVLRYVNEADSIAKPLTRSRFQSLDTVTQATDLDVSPTLRALLDR